MQMDGIGRAMNELMENYDKLNEENARLRKENANLHQRLVIAQIWIDGICDEIDRRSKVMVDAGTLDKFIAFERKKVI